MTRAIVLTPQMCGADGVSEMTRQVVRALDAQVGRTLDAVEVWSLDDEGAPATLGPATSFRTAAGSRMTYAAFGLRGVNADTLVIVLHAHLLPVTLPMIRSGARVVPILLGVEVWKPLRRLERAALRRAWRVGAISRHTVVRFRAANPEFATLEVHVCAPGTATEAGEVDAAEDPRALDQRSPHGSNTLHGPEVLIVGRMSAVERYKGHDDLLDIWPAVRAAIPGATLVVVGGGDDRPRLEARVNALGLSDGVRFEGVVSCARLAELYRQAAIFVMPSANEGFGLVYVEAMGAGVPCVAARGAAEEVIDDGVTGAIVEAGDRGALATAVIGLLGDPVRRARLGAAARREALRRFSHAAFTERLCGLLALSEDAAASAVVGAAC